ncbi:reverse transcriptase/maturase family protein [Sulfitobacter sp. D7]|uniref:reverse transcriptase/maturase family protein n=1 Tax=Sulfitobacter sp. D7 TaxID=1968541 RepID=UPI000E776E6C|nr:reverse transcriptase/maturase family protein [Sulfitobacter sp. D7]AYE85909.1 hypothetical protein B5M07_07180 [Sulfitobacter sp. D7]
MKETPGRIFDASFNAVQLKELFDLYIEERSAVGRDGVSSKVFASRIDSEMDIILRKVRNCSYEFSSYREKLISKGPSKPPRQISIPTVRDKLVLKFLAEFLARVYPEHVSRVPHSTIKQVHLASKNRPASDSYLRLDIESYFPSIDHKILMRILRRKIRKKEVLHLIENAISTPTGVKKIVGQRNEKGVPQGLSISNILSSIYLSDFDNKMSEVPDISYFRYVDDVLILGNPAQVSELSLSLPKLLKSKRKIKCHPVGPSGKSVIVPLPNGIDYLGYYFRLDRIEVRRASYKKMFSNIMKIISGMKYAKNKGPLIWKMNLRISGCHFANKNIGWLFFFSQTKNIKQLSRLDAFVKQKAGEVLAAGDLERIKRFVKTYHEIRYNADNSAYFPNFDNFDSEQKKQQIGVLMPRKSREELDALSPEDLEVLFVKCISREIADLERDMMEAFS